MCLISLNLTGLYACPLSGQVLQEPMIFVNQVVNCRFVCMRIKLLLWSKIDHWPQTSSNVSLSHLSALLAAPFGLSVVTVGVGMGPMRAAKSKPISRKGSASSSGSGSPAPSSNGSCASPRERTGNYDLLNLPKVWDDLQPVRDRLRDENPLLMAFDIETGKLVDRYVEGTLETVKCNVDVLVPLATLMGKNGILMPTIDRLIQAIDQAYRIAKKPRSYEHSYQMAWAFRRLLGKIKSYCYKPSPPEESKLHEEIPNVLKL